jgi:hypothetical protein
MAYSELIKNFEHIRDYMREFFVFGFKSRDQFDQKSSRSYDNERRRVESWLGDYMSFRMDPTGKTVFLSVDSRHIPFNPLYQAWKSASFTRFDIGLHFLLLDILRDGTMRAVPEIIDILVLEYLSKISYSDPPDESTIRKKLKEYVELGLIKTQKQGKQLLYSIAEDQIELSSWETALSFFSEVNPLGVIGSFCLDRLGSPMPHFIFKHHYLLFSLDSGILNDLLIAIHEHRLVELDVAVNQGNYHNGRNCLPMKIYISVQGGRSYLAGYNFNTKRIHFYRLDMIKSVKIGAIEPDYEKYEKIFQNSQNHIWGATTTRKNLEHIEMTIEIDPASERHIVERMKREKRCGTVSEVSAGLYRFEADVFDSNELLPWLRTFIGYITQFTCTNTKVLDLFWSDFFTLQEMYQANEEERVY